MGAYLSQPKTDKVSTDESNDYLAVGASSMQGWRNSQEDAHNSLLNFDKDTAFFAVYDGHGGAEVSTYCADKLPQFLKALATYNDGNFEQALIEAFLGFDKTLLEPEVIEILKVLAGEKNFADADDSDALEDDEDEDLAELHEEGNLPLDEVMEKYKGHPSMPSLKKLKDNNSSKPQSPYLRGRRAAAVIADAANRAELDPDAKPEGSSTSKAALAALQDGPSSSKSSSSSASKMETEEDSTVSSSSSSASKSNSNNNSTKNAAEAEASTTAEVTENGQTTATDAEVPDSSAPKENEQNGSVSSSEVKKKDIPSTSSPNKEDDVVSGSSDGNNKKEHKQNGSVESSTKSPTKQEANSSSITSTSKDKKKAKIDEDEEEDGDFDANESNARQALEYSSEDEEELDEDDTTDEDADYDDIEVEEDDEEVEDEEEDEESYLANEQFCANMIEEPGKDSGCTAVVGLLNGRDLYVANAGDSRCVVCRKGEAIEMSLDHKPEDDKESSRIIKAGGRVTLDGRVNGGLNLSRALGDHAYKMNHDLPAEEQMISALPDIKKLIISPDDEFMVLACDGIWNFMTSEEVVEFVRLRINDENKKMSEICEELFEACLAPNTLGDGTGCDNMTAVIVRFKPSILELPSKINPNETEDVLLAKQEAEAEKSGQKVQKRAASPTSDDNDSNEAENKKKRFKTDADDEENKTTSSSSFSSSSPKTKSLSSNTTTTTTSSMPANSTDAASTTTTTATSVKSKEVQKECDSAVASST